MQWDFRKTEWKIMCMFSKYVEILKLQAVLDLLCCIITLQICCKFWYPGRHQEIPLEQSGSFSLYFLKIHRYKKLKVHSVTNIPNSRNRLEYPGISVSFFFPVSRNLFLCLHDFLVHWIFFSLQKWFSLIYVLLFTANWLSMVP